MKSHFSNIGTPTAQHHRTVPSASWRLRCLALGAACLLNLGAATSAQAQSSCIVDGITNVRESYSYGFREARYDVLQYRVYSNGSASFIQRINGLGYTNDGGTYGSASNRALFAAKLAWMKWANGSYVISQYQRPSWLPVSGSMFNPDISVSSGTWYFKVAVSGGSSGGSTGGGSSPTPRLVDDKLLQDVFKAVIKSNGSLRNYDWTSLKRLTGNQIRMLYTELGRQAAQQLNNPALQKQFTDLGNNMALLLEQQLSNVAKGTPASLVAAAKSLRGNSSTFRKVIVGISQVYVEMFDSAVSYDMLRQLAGYTRDYETTMRRAEGNWTLNSPDWTRREGNNPVFTDLVGANGVNLEYTDTGYPWVTVKKWNNSLYFEPDTDANGQMFWDNRVQRWYFMQATSSGTKFWIWDAKTKKWIVTQNPLR